MTHHNTLALLLEAADKYDWMFADTISAKQLGIHLTCEEVDALIALDKIRNIPGTDWEWVAEHQRRNPGCHRHHAGPDR